MEYLINEVIHQKVYQCLNITSMGNSAPKTLKTKDQKGQDLDISAVNYKSD